MMEDNFIGDTMMNITHQVTEIQDEFIFETLSNWLSNSSYQIKISKQELVDAIMFYRKAKKEDLHEVRVNCEISKRYVEQLSEDFGEDEVREYATSKLMMELQPYVKKNLTCQHHDIVDSLVYSFSAYIRHGEAVNDRTD